MLYLPILVPTFWWQIWCQNIEKGWGGIRGKTPEIGIVTVGEEIVPNWMWFEEMELGEGRHPCGTYLPTEE